MLRRAAAAAVVIMLAACGGGGGTAASSRSASSDAGLGVVSVALELGGGRDSDLVRQNDNPGSSCGLRTSRGIGIATDGHIEVTDENHTIVGRSSVVGGQLVENSLITQPGGALLGMRCDFHFSVEITGRPKYMTFVIDWTGAASEVSVDAKDTDVHNGQLTLEKFLG